MRYQPIPIAPTRRRLLALTGYLKRLLSDGRFLQLETSEQQNLLMRLRSLARRLRHVVSRKRFREALGVIAIAATASYGQAQDFAPPQPNPFGIEADAFEFWLASPQFADIDQDGDYDLLYVVNDDEQFEFYKLEFQENIGTPTSPAFGPLQSSPFGAEGLLSATMMTLGDLDADGDLDMLIGQYDVGFGFDNEAQGFLYLENTGTATQPAFAAPLPNPFGLDDAEQANFYPNLADLDGDGDLDLLVGTYPLAYDESKSLLFYENTGTPTMPAFSEPVANPFGINFPVEEYGIVPVQVDLDEDGDLDLFIGGGAYINEAEGIFRTKLDYYENTGSPDAPSFGNKLIEPFGLIAPNLSYNAYPTAADLDQDGDIDILLSTLVYDEEQEEGFPSFFYFENTTINSTEDLAETEVAFKLFPSVATDQLQWQLPPGTAVDGLRLQIFNAGGQAVYEQPLQAETGAFSVRQLPAGLYHLRLHDEQGMPLGVRRFVRE